VSKHLIFDVLVVKLGTAGERLGGTFAGAKISVVDFE
jgi:hypothetical protein